MRECDKSKNTCKQQLSIVYMSFNNVGHLITSTFTTLQHFTTLYHISPNYTSLHLLTLHFLSFALHYSTVWLDPSTLPIDLFHPPSLNQTQYGSHIPKLISKVMTPFTALKNFSPFLFISFIHFFFHFSYQPFTSFMQSGFKKLKIHFLSLI